MSSNSYDVSEASDRLQELLERTQRGEGILITREGEPVARLVAPKSTSERVPGALRELLTDSEIEALNEAIESPLSPEEQLILEGGGTDELGIWTGLPPIEQRAWERNRGDRSHRGSADSKSAPTGEAPCKLLLDSHALYWWLLRSPELSPSAQAAISSKSNQVLVSAVGYYELLFKAGRGRLPTSLKDLQMALDNCGFATLPVTVAHAESAAELDWQHGDPWDRILAAQAIAEQACVVSIDAVFDQVGIHRLW